MCTRACTPSKTADFSAGQSHINQQVRACANRVASIKDWNDLIDRVQGIGPAKAGKLSAEGLTVNGAVFAQPGATAAAKLVTDKKQADRA